MPYRLLLAVFALVSLTVLFAFLAGRNTDGAGLIVALAILLLVVPACAALLLWFSARGGLTEPVNRLTVAFEDFGRGQTPARVPEYGFPAVAHAARAFNETTARLQAVMQARAEEQSQLEALLTSTADGLIALDAAGVVQFVNPAVVDLLAIEPPAKDNTLLEWTRDPDLHQMLRRCLATGQRQRGQLALQRGSRWVEATFAPIRGGGAWAVLCVLHDLTDVRRAETARRDFVANVSHELRTPLAAIRAVTETLRDGAISDPVVAGPFLESVEHQVDRLVQLVNELLELARIESGAAPFRFETVGVADLLERAAGRFRLQTERAGLELKLVTPPDGLAVRGDPARLDRVLDNLLSNAIKFTPAGGVVTLRGRQDGDRALIEVADTGMGIDPHDLPRIFERFYMTDRARAGKGVGLGLAIVKHTVRAHGGEVTAQSDVGRGSRFTITLPLVIAS